MRNHMNLRVPTQVHDDDGVRSRCCHETMGHISQGAVWYKMMFPNGHLLI